MKITGGIVSIGDLEVFSSGKRKKSIVLYTFETKSRLFEIHFYDEKIEQLEGLERGDHVTIKFDLQPEIFVDKDESKSYFTHIVAIEILYRKKYY